jgi:hypothetical protein
MRIKSPSLSHSLENCLCKNMFSPDLDDWDIDLTNKIGYYLLHTLKVHSTLQFNDMGPCWKLSTCRHSQPTTGQQTLSLCFTVNPSGGLSLTSTPN